MSKPVLFSDIDGTLCFHGEANDVKVLGQTDDGFFRVSDVIEGGEWACHDVSTSSYSVFFAQKTRELLHELKHHMDIVLITGGRTSTYEKRKKVLDFAKMVVVENGGLIFSPGMNRDEFWWEQFQEQRGELQEVEHYIKSYDWVLDNEGRTTMLRVRLKDNPHKDAEKFARLCKAVRLPSSLKSTINLGNLDIVPTLSGKDNAVRYLQKKLGVSQGMSYGVGDDINDAPFLRLCDVPFVLKSAYPQVLEEAREKSWRISNRRTFGGIHEILEGLIQLFK
jgi:hydroxymethylpyrimidine pyrophosphatase-like HAD family hydrolase